MPKPTAELLAKLFSRKNLNLSMGYAIFGIAHLTTIIIIASYPIDVNEIPETLDFPTYI